MKTDRIENNTEKKLIEIKVLLEKKEKGKGTAWSKGRKQKNAEMILLILGIKEMRLG